MTEKEKYDYFCENCNGLNDENKDKLLEVGEKLLEIKNIVNETEDKKEGIKNQN